MQQQRSPRPSFHALKPLVSPPNVLRGAKAAAHTAGASGGGGGGKPIMEWLSRKLGGHGKRPLTSGVSAMPGRSTPAVADTGTPARASSTETATTTATTATTTLRQHQKPSKEKPASSSSFVRQASSLGISSRKKQVMANHSTTLEPPPRRRRSSHHASSIKSASARSSRAPLFSPPRSSIIARYPRAATFMTRSSTSPASSFISSRRSPSEETEHSLAGSYLDVNDPDSRSFVPSASADEDASLRPFPPSLYPSSPSHRRTSSIDSAGGGGGRYSRNSIDGLASLRGDPAAANPDTHTHTTGNNDDGQSDTEFSPSPSGFPLRRASQSTIATTQSSFGAHSRAWTSDLSRGARSVDTRPTTILSSSLDLPRVAHIAQVSPPFRVPPPQNRTSFVVSASSSSSNASALAPAVSILDGVPHRRVPSSGNYPLSLGTIHRVDSGLSTSPSVSSPLATGAVFTRSRDASREDDEEEEEEEDDVRDVTRTTFSLEPETCRFATASIRNPVRTTTTRDPADESYPCHVPHHSQRHPRHNPRPLSPPNENASLLTLASSTFTDAAAIIDRHQRRRSGERASMVEGTSFSSSSAGVGSIHAGREPRVDHQIAPPTSSSSVAVSREITLTPTDHDGFPCPDVPYSRAGGVGEEDEADEYDDHHQGTPVIIGGMYNERDGGSFRFAAAGGGSHHRPPSYFDRASSYYFNPLGGGGGAGSVRASIGGGGGVAGSWMDDRASVTAMRRRGSWESGESSFSWVGAAAAAATPMTTPTTAAAAVRFGSGSPSIAPMMPTLPPLPPPPPVLGRDMVSSVQQLQHPPFIEQDGVAAARPIEFLRTDGLGTENVGLETRLATSLDRLNVQEEQARG